MQVRLRLMLNVVIRSAKERPFAERKATLTRFCSRRTGLDPCPLGGQVSEIRWLAPII